MTAMLIRVRVQARARKAEVEAMPGGRLKVRVTAPAHEGKANQALVMVLARHFGVSKSRVRIVAGLASRSKLVEIAQ
jgi:hypothetical protein